MPDIKELQINGRTMPVEADAERTLLSVLRDDLDLTGTKYGCGEGECGACTVHIDGVAARSCQRKIGNLAGKKITTIEGLSTGGKLHALQQAFWDVGALQCGYCTPGMIMQVTALLKDNPSPTEQEVREGIEGNLCRCTGYHNIVKAVMAAASGNVGGPE